MEIARMTTFVKCGGDDDADDGKITCFVLIGLFYVCQCQCIEIPKGVV
jgi:hypothetical protein